MRYSVFKSAKRTDVEISTASLPDIIFMLLFLFMVVTVLRKHTPLVNIQLPLAEELTKLENKSLVHHIHIGYPHKQPETPRIQLNDKFADVDDIVLYIGQTRFHTPEALHKKMITSIKVDRGVTMGIVQDVKLELRKANQLKISYAATPLF